MLWPLRLEPQERNIGRKASFLQNFQSAMADRNSEIWGLLKFSLVQWYSMFLRYPDTRFRSSGSNPWWVQPFPKWTLRSQRLWQEHALESHQQRTGPSVFRIGPSLTIIPLTVCLQGGRLPSQEWAGDSLCGTWCGWDWAGMWVRETWIPKNCGGDVVLSWEDLF